MQNYDGKKIRFGVISASPMGCLHMEGIVRNKHTELVAICDLDKGRAGAAADRFGMDGYYTDYLELLKRDDIDAVVIATPDREHPEHAVAAMEAGKHVLCEKPMALSREECMEMIKTSERTGKKLMIGQICRYTPGFRLAKKLIDEGQIGELFYVESEYAHDCSKIPGLGNWRMDPVRLRYPFLGGGCHPVDLLRWIAGNPYEVMAYSNRKVLKHWPVDDTTIAIMRFPNDVLGKVFVSIGCRRRYSMRSVFYGDKGTIIADNTTPYITIFKTEIKSGEKYFEGPEDQAIGLTHPVELNSHNASAEIDEFTQCILEDKPVLTDGREGAKTVIACLAAVESCEKHEIIPIDYNLD